MKVRSDSLPQNDFEINNIVGNECDVVFFDVENHTEEQDENGKISYEYDAYTIKTTYRSNLGADRLGLDIPTEFTMTTIISSLKKFFTALKAITNNEWATYRQQLRDITEQNGFPFNVEFPEKPKK